MAKSRFSRMKITKRSLQDQLNEQNERYFKLENLIYALAEHCKCYINNGPIVVPFDAPGVKGVDGA